MTEMSVSENLWSEDELLEQLEQMQDQIEKLQAEKEEIIRYRSAAEKWHMAQEQKHSSEILALQSALQQAQNKLQEQSDQIVRLSGADLILKENERMKLEVRGARAAIIHYESAYQNRIKNLEAAEADIKRQQAELQRMKNNEKSLIARKAKEIATPQVLLAQRDRDNAKAEMKYRHEEDTKNLKKWLLFLFAYAVSMTMLMVGLYASEVLNKTSRQLILTTLGIHALYLCIKVQRDT